ncbi:MAG: PD-(D/E)XK nuclease family transposase [Bacteroidales bacterium]|nr:PD-(D/E)XK nuclease family transposase [Bacteroidales bacterium]
MSKYINPYTDFGFKKLFGTEFNKDLLMSFLNALFEKSNEIPKDEILDITYLNAEKLGRKASERKAIFDVYCTTKSGAKFIVEMQNVFQQFFKDRSVYYSSFPIREMAKRDSSDEHWNYELQKIYTVGILNFVFKDEEKDNKTSELKTVNEFSDDDLMHVVMLTDRMTGKVFYEKLAYIYLEMPKFDKKENELETMYEKWLFVLKNLPKLLERPKELQDRIFDKLFKQAEIAMFTDKEYSDYEESLHNLWDITNAMNDAENKGARQNALENAKRMKAKGFDFQTIADITLLSIKDIEKL